MVQTSSFVDLEKQDEGKITGRLRIYITKSFEKAIRINNRTAIWNAIFFFVPEIKGKFDNAAVICHRNMYKSNEMHKILVIRLYFPLDALHVSDYISPSSGATL